MSASDIHQAIACYGKQQWWPKANRGQMRRAPLAVSRPDTRRRRLRRTAVASHPTATFPL